MPCWLKKQIQIKHEYYFAVLYDKKTNSPMIMASAAGGVDIEQVSHENPEKIILRNIDIVYWPAKIYTPLYGCQAGY